MKAGKNLFCVYCVLVLVFCLSMATAKAQLITDSVLIEGHYRTFLYNNPGTDKRESLVFVMHGSGGNATNMISAAAKLEAKSKSEKLIVVYPNGYLHYWNECRKAATSVANIENINENAFFEAMIKYFATKYKIDTKKVYASGMSGGGHMAYKLALTMPQKIRAIAVVVANLPDTSNMDCIEVKRPVPVMIINGTEDPLNLYNGGMMVIGNVVLGQVRSTDKTFKYWADIGGYTGEPVMETLPDADTTDQRTIERYTYKKKGKPEVVLLKVIGGKHEHPKEIDAYEEAWNFFKRQ